LAVENCQYEEGRLKIKSALMILKGDIDNLGLLFHQVKSPTFATMAQLSRQLNNFFCVWLPWFCKSNKAAHNIYTVFAGGDDFYLIAPWIDGINFVPQLKAHFDDFVCRQKFPTFSIGMYMTRSGSELLSASEKVEDALNEAKARQDVSGALVKNAVCCFNQTVSHEEYQDLVRLASRFDTIKFAKDKTLSIAFVYSLLSLCQQAAEADDINLPNTKHSLSAALWRSRLVYRTTRFVETAAGSDLSDEEKQSIIKEITTDIGNAIAQYKNHYIIALYLWLYQQREN
jgi:CRISPR-associated protein Csm1